MLKSPKEQILDRCKEVIDKAKTLYGLDLSKVIISFNLRGTSAGQAGYTRDFHKETSYRVKFNHDMLSRDAFSHVFNDTVPHEFGHICCYMNPSLGRNHDNGWKRVCIALGGSGESGHCEEIIFGKGNTYEYITTLGHKVRLSEKYHKRIQQGGILTFRRNKGSVSKVNAYSIVGFRGQTLAKPIVRRDENHPGEIEHFMRKQNEVKIIAPLVTHNITPDAQTITTGTSKAAVSRNIMLRGYQAGHTYEQIITDMISANGYSRALARATFKANCGKVGIPEVY